VFNLGLKIDCKKLIKYNKNIFDFNKFFAVFFKQVKIKRQKLSKSLKENKSESHYVYP